MRKREFGSSPDGFAWLSAAGTGGHAFLAAVNHSESPCILCCDRGFAFCVRSKGGCLRSLLPFCLTSSPIFCRLHFLLAFAPQTCNKKSGQRQCSKADVALLFYASLYLISLANQQITRHLERLKAAHILAPKPAEIRKLAVNQLRAAAVMNLTSEEMDEAYQQEGDRLRLEKRLTKLRPKKQLTTCNYSPSRVAFVFQYAGSDSVPPLQGSRRFYLSPGLTAGAQ